MQDIPQQTAVQQAGKSPHTLIMIAIAVVVIVIIAGAFLALNGMHGATAPSPGQQTQSSNHSLGSNSTRSSGGLMSELSSGSNSSTKGVLTVATQKVASSIQFNVSYAGTLETQTGGISLRMPMDVGYEKYGNNSRINLNLSSIPLLGNLSFADIQDANGTAYLCSQLFASSNTSRIGCQASSSKNNTGLNLSAYTGPLSGNQSVDSSNVMILGQKSHNGMGCVLVQVEGSPKTGNSTGKYALTMCLSEQYNVPLNVSLVSEDNSSSGNYMINAILNETSIGKPVTIAEVTSLPGPVVNGTYNGFSTGSLKGI